LPARPCTILLGDSLLIQVIILSYPPKLIEDISIFNVRLTYTCTPKKFHYRLIYVHLFLFSRSCNVFGVRRLMKGIDQIVCNIGKNFYTCIYFNFISNIIFQLVLDAPIWHHKKQQNGSRIRHQSEEDQKIYSDPCMTRVIFFPFVHYYAPLQRSGGILLCICLSVRRPNGFRVITKECLGLGTSNLVWWLFMTSRWPPYWGQGVKGQGHIDLVGKKRFPSDN
jgi:hypothetical protein